MNKTILVTVSDDRFGRKDGKYEQTQKKIENLFVLNNPKFGIDRVSSFTFEDIKFTQFYKGNKILLDNTDAGRNGRVYKPFVILDTLRYAEDGDFVIYTDCSPEMWKMKEDYIINKNIFDIQILKDLCIKNNDILNVFVKWSDKTIHHHIDGDLGKHTHRYFTMDRCMDKMGLRFYEDCYMGASGMWCIRKTKATVKLVEEWLYWNCIDECCALGKKEIPDDTSYWTAESHAVFGTKGYKMGHRHDQSIIGLLLNKTNHKCIDIIYNDMNPYNFLQFCRKGVEYKFIESCPKIKVGDTVYNVQGTEMKVWRIDLEDGKERFIVGKLEESCYGTNRENLKLKYKED